MTKDDAKRLKAQIIEAGKLVRQRITIGPLLYNDFKKYVLSDKFGVGSGCYVHDDHILVNDVRVEKITAAKKGGAHDNERNPKL